MGGIGGIEHCQPRGQHRAGLVVVDHGRGQQAPPRWWSRLYQWEKILRNSRTCSNLLMRPGNCGRYFIVLNPPIGEWVVVRDVLPAVGTW